MNRLRVFLLACLALVILGAIDGAVLIHRGFSAKEEPSAIEKLVARTVRNLSIPASTRRQTNPWKPTPENLQEARNNFLARCATCHGTDGSGVTQVGRNLYPKPPDLRAPANAEPYGRRNPLHHPERCAPDGHACVGESTRRSR